MITPEDTIGPATPQDVEPVRRLLVEAELPEAGLLDQFPSAYAVAKRDGQLVGVAGLEVYGASGLLRSVAVAPARRRSGLGRALVASRLAAAREARLEAVYLLTLSAADFFRALGFVPARRDAVPAAIAASPELAGVCPASATCLAFFVP
jgi:amino-acid N-acetyltransferase